jgi:hypothetical protein
LIKQNIMVWLLENSIYFLVILEILIILK